jgi:poly(3-hydroxybutyrate) depolymerase
MITRPGWIALSKDCRPVSVQTPAIEPLVNHQHVNGCHAHGYENVMNAHRYRQTLARLAAIALLVLACSREHPQMQPGQVRAFQIPVGRPDGSRDSTLCLFSVPEGYNRDRPWPLLVALHGYGSGAEPFHQLWQQTASGAGYILVTPQGADPTTEGIGWAWGPAAEETIRHSIDAIGRTVRIDRSRIFLTGFSQGGWLTYAMALEYPHVFRGIAPIGAGRDLPDSSRLHLLRGIAVYIGHGSMEPGLEEVRNLAAMLRAHGCEVLLREYPDTGHGFPEPMSVELSRILKFFEAAD